MHFDTSLRATWKVEQGHLVRRLTQPDRDAIMDANAELRKNEGALRPLSFAGLALRIPDLDLMRLWKKYPDLKAPDAATRRAAWLRFIGSAEADPYRVQDRKRRPRITA